jgi:hypothetical protein
MNKFPISKYMGIPFFWQMTLPHIPEEGNIEPIAATKKKPYNSQNFN